MLPSTKVLCCPARTEWRRVACDPSLAEGERNCECWTKVEIPATYRDVCRRVCVKEPSCRTETIPPEYRTVSERVCVKPGYWKSIPVPARYETRTRRVCVEPCRCEWRRNPECDVPGPAAPAADDAGN